MDFIVVRTIFCTCRVLIAVSQKRGVFHIVFALSCMLTFCSTVRGLSNPVNSPGGKSSSSCNHKLFVNSRSDVLNLLNHPLQLQLATGDLPLGSFRRLVRDRAIILEGLKAVSSSAGIPMDEEISRHASESPKWLEQAENSGKTIVVPGIACYNCGGEHLNIDCPEDNHEASPSAHALKSVLQTHSLAGTTALLRAYSFACSRALEVALANKCSTVYHGWLEEHATRWSSLASTCEEQLGENNSDSTSYTICLSMFYNWIDSEAATTGIRLEDDGSTMSTMLEDIERLEPGYAAQRDKHQSFVADITGVATMEVKKNEAAAKVNAAAAYLAAKKKGNKS